MTMREVNAASPMSFDAWGKRREAERWSEAAPLAVNLEGLLRTSSTHGYTGHEMAEAVGVIHMNGRLYDPHFGRFLQADPLVQSPQNLQSWNRYSYGALPIKGGEGALYSGGRLTAAGYAVRTLTYGAVGGVMSELQGGRFGHGFASAGVSAALSPAIDRIGNDVAGTLASAVVGGTASQLAGGKFANGAVTGAFGYAFGATMNQNSELITGSSDGPLGMASVPDEIVVGESGFDDPNKAGKAFGDAYHESGVAKRVEYQTGIVQLGPKNFGYIIPGAGPVDATRVDPTPLFNAIRGAGFRIVAWDHTHWDDNLKFSGADMQFVHNNNATMYMTNSAGETYKLNPGILNSAASSYRGANRVMQFINGSKGIQGERIW